MDPPKHTHQTPHSPQVRYLPQCEVSLEQPVFFLEGTKKITRTNKLHFFNVLGGTRKVGGRCCFELQVFQGEPSFFVEVIEGDL